MELKPGDPTESARVGSHGGIRAQRGNLAGEEEQTSIIRGRSESQSARVPESDQDGADPFLSPLPALIGALLCCSMSGREEVHTSRAGSETTQQETEGEERVHTRDQSYTASGCAEIQWECRILLLNRHMFPEGRDGPVDSRLLNTWGLRPVPGSGHPGRRHLWARVALAAALIKGRAAGASGREHAETWADLLKKQDESWRNRAEELQLEVLRLRQEVVRVQARSWTASAGVTDAADPENRPTTPNLPSGPNSPELFESDLSVTPDLELPDGQAAQRPDPPHLNQNLPSSRAEPRQRMLLPHVQLLQALTSLSRISSCEGALDSWWPEPDGGPVLVETVVQLLESVAAVTQGSALLTPSDLILTACRASTETLDLLCCRRLQSEDLMRRVRDVLRQLTSTLLDTDHSSQLEAAEVLVQCLTVLGRSSVTGSFLVGHLLSQVSAVADRLWRILQDASDPDTFPVDQYQNSCYLFQVLEQLLQQSPELRHLGGSGSEPARVLRQLERRVLWMSEEFPLFSIYMWRIGRSLACPDR
ncbi:meiosis-specific protein MEI4 [Neosynchiropus ocellatus]